MTCRNTFGPSGMTSLPGTRQVAVGRRDRGRQLPRSWRWLRPHCRLRPPFTPPSMYQSLIGFADIRAALLLGQSQNLWPTSSSGHFELWPLQPLATSSSGHFNLWPLRALAISTSGLFVLWPLWIHPVWASWPLLANSTSGQYELEDLMNSWTLWTLAKTTSGQYESLDFVIRTRCLVRAAFAVAAARAFHGVGNPYGYGYGVDFGWIWIFFSWKVWSGVGNGVKIQKWSAEYLLPLFFPYSMK